jgi:hypothetical protein
MKISKGVPSRSNPYHIIEGRDSGALKSFLVKHGQGLLPMVELIEQSQVVADEMIDVWGG